MGFLKFQVKENLANDMAESLDSITEMCSKGDGYNLNKLNDDELILSAYALGLVEEIMRNGEKRK